MISLTGVPSSRRQETFFSKNIKRGKVVEDYNWHWQMSSRSSFLSLLFLCERDYMFGRSIVDYYVTAWRKTIGNHRSFFDRLHSKERNSNGERAKRKSNCELHFCSWCPALSLGCKCNSPGPVTTQLMDRSTSKKLWLTPTHYINIDR